MTNPTQAPQPDAHARCVTSSLTSAQAPRYFDTHCHAADAAFDGHHAALRALAADSGVARALVCTCGAQDYARARKLCLGQSNLSYAAGVFDMNGDFLLNGRQALEALQKEILDAKDTVRAIGEVGIDARHLKRGLLAQAEAVLDAAVELALACDLPLSIHARAACGHVVRILKRHRNTGLRGVIHAFNGSAEEARVFLGLGFKLGFGTVLLNPRAKKAARTLASLSNEDFVLETDAPFMAAACRKEAAGSGKSAAAHAFVLALTTPEDLPRVALAAAHIRGEPLCETAAHAWANACALFGT